MSTTVWKERTAADLRWMPQMVEIKTPEGRAPRPGWVCDELPGLAIVVVAEEDDCPRTSPLSKVPAGAALFPSEMTLTHIASGLMVAVDKFVTLARVARLSRDAFGVDWSLPKCELAKTDELKKFGESTKPCRSSERRLSWSEWARLQETSLTRKKTGETPLVFGDIPGDQIRSLIGHFESRAAGDPHDPFFDENGGRWKLVGEDATKAAKIAASDLRWVEREFRRVGGVRYRLTTDERTNPRKKVKRWGLSLEVWWPSGRTAAGEDLHGYLCYRMPLCRETAP